MSEAKTGILARLRRRDRWGLRPVRSGRIRGQIRNFRRSLDVDDLGQVFIIDFDLFVDDDQPLVPVRMSGTDCQGDAHDGDIVEVRDPGRGVRPVPAVRLYYPPHYVHEVVSFYPGRDDLPPARQRMNSLLVVAGPVILTAIAVAVFLALYR